MDYRYKKDFPNGLKDVLLPREQFLPLPKYEDEAAWLAMTDDARAMIIEKAEELLTTSMPRATATVYMNYYRTGERDYDYGVDAPMRHPLFWLTAAECVERKGRFMDKLIDYIWALCETTSWVLPAHNWKGLEGGYDNTSTRPLPDIKDPQVDLFAATTGEYMAWALYIMRNKLDEISFLISERIEYELNKRIIEPFCNRRDDWWVADTTHNWHMWISSNCLAVILLAETNPAKRVKAVELALRYTEEFYRDHIADGSTNEGPGYWVAAAGSMYYALKLLKLASNGAIDQFDEPVVRNIAAYFYHLHINDRNFYNYDLNCRFVNSALNSVVYDFGKEINNPAMMALGAYMYHFNKRPLQMSDHAYEMFSEMLYGSELEKITPKAPNIGYYYSDAQQLMVAREVPGTAEGFYLGAKGFNGQFEGHRDGGSFLLYNGNKPVYIEIGAPSYNRRVIDGRYRTEHFVCVPQSHNAITVNGMGQKPGKVVGDMSEAKLHSKEAKESSTRSVSTDNGITAALTVKMGHLFPAGSGVQICERTFTLDRTNGTVTVHQKVECDRESDICLHFITCEKPVLDEGIYIGGTKLIYDTALFTAKTEEIDTEHDKRIEQSWGAHIYRTTLTAHAKTLDAAITISKE